MPAAKPLPEPVEEESASAEPGTPAGPSPAEEAAFPSEQRIAEAAEAPPSVAASVTADEPGSLPPMEDLVQRIPAPVREQLGELFRAKFVTVKRIPGPALKG